MRTNKLFVAIIFLSFLVGCKIETFITSATDQSLAFCEDAHRYDDFELEDFENLNDVYDDGACKAGVMEAQQRAYEYLGQSRWLTTPNYTETSIIMRKARGYCSKKFKDDWKMAYSCKMGIFFFRDTLSGYGPEL